MSRLSAVSPLAAWLAWAGLCVLPEWAGLGADLLAGEQRASSRLEYELGYTSGWLTRYYQRTGELLVPMPPNPGAGESAEVAVICPRDASDLVSEGSGWALCPVDRSVRAMRGSVAEVQSLAAPQAVELFPR